MTTAQLVAALGARKGSIQAAWLASRTQPGTEVYATFLAAYGEACKRYWRAAILLG
jgi:hypothetical protein